ncbi:MAG: hypothetical protein ACRBBP_01495 [Bdellovibrionales bacterium]
MDDSNKELVEEKTPEWSCELSPVSEEASTVGDIKTLKCTGFDFVPVGKDYSIKLEDKDEHVLKILSVKSNTQSLKEFDVTSYRAVKGDVKIEVQAEGETVFLSAVKGLNVKSVVENPQKPKPFPPQSGYYVLPGLYESIFLGLALMSLITLFVIRVRKNIKKANEFKRIVLKSNYADPFMDFNVEIREYTKEKKPSVLFLDMLDDTLKKVLFRVFDEVVSFDDLDYLIKKMKGLGLEQHEVRGFYVLEEEYKKFKVLYESKKGQVLEEKNEFLSQMKTTINKLRRYVEVEG